ncbi:MAG: ornithine cyclodeaminase family protein [Gemmatimonadota bacterium]|nr:ornithine cyclodeaminase family protein [Gemmatimonadota bacterium]
MPTILELTQIKRLVDVPELIREIESGFVLYSGGHVTVPPVGFLHFDDPPGDVHIKYGFISGDEHYVLKMASAFYDNPSSGLPPSDGLLLVFSQKTGALELILLDECWLTDMRTAAAGAVAAKHLAPTGVDRIGIVGTGVQARMQLEMLREVVDCGACWVWGRNPTKVREMIADLRARDTIQSWGLDIRSAPSLDELVSESSLIVTATSTRAPLIRSEHVKPGTHITAMGSDDHGKQELEADLLGKADVVVADSRAQCVDHGECSPAVRDGYLAEEAIVEMGEVIQDPMLGRTSDDQITIADLTGVAVQDIQIAKMVARGHAALARGAV